MANPGKSKKRQAPPALRSIAAAAASRTATAPGAGGRKTSNYAPAHEVLSSAPLEQAL